MTQPGDDALRADLVCEGGGVKGVALAGAVTSLAEAGYTFPRVAGSSAGAIVGALVAALQTAGEPVTRLNELLGALDLSRFRDPSRLGRVPLVGRALSLLITDGIYQGAYLERFLEEVLGDLGVRTFGDLRTGEDTQQYAYSLVITASDLSRRRLVRLPWDLPSYGVDPDTFSVARAVRASAAIPLFFRPVRVRGATWVDGGLLSNFPVELFDQPAAVAPRWPTFGVRLTARPGTPPVTHPVRGPVNLALASLETLFSARDASYVNDPCSVRRTIFVETEQVSALDFALTSQQSQGLYDAGHVAASRFLQTWDFAAYVRRCRTPPPDLTLDGGGLAPNSDPTVP